MKKANKKLNAWREKKFAALDKKGRRKNKGNNPGPGRGKRVITAIPKNSTAISSNLLNMVKNLLARRNKDR